jgi:quercetin dioxygenase-like cupin family protein
LPGTAAPAAPAAPDEERLAAIQKAMNELDEAVQQCWAVAATERFDIEGELAVLIDIAPPGAQASHVSVVRDTVRNPTLVACVQKLLAAYRFAPPLRGQAIQLPFKFRAPDGQNTIDRALVGWHGQPSGAGTVSVAVLLDESNTGNDAASMFEVAISPGASTGLRRTERAELWYFLDDAQVRSSRVKEVAAGDVMHVPAGGVREVRASASGHDARAVVVVMPGGREGVARAGALPTPEASLKDAPRPGVDPLPAVTSQLTFLRPSGAARQLKASPTTQNPSSGYVGAHVVALPAGDRTAEHLHPSDTELWYVLSGSGTLTVAGVELPVTSTSVVQIPNKTRHGFTATSDVRMLQILAHAAPAPRGKAQP